MTDVLHVAVAVLVDGNGRVLVNQRLPGSGMAGLWEFPGGKLARGEDIRAALARELDEELGIRPTDARPLIRIQHDYPEKRVLLDVWRVAAWNGVVRAREGHPLRWMSPDDLVDLDLLDADRPITAALRLPSRYAITGEAGHLVGIAGLIERGHTLIQLRIPTFDEHRFRDVARQAIRLCRDRGVTLLLNADPEVVLELDADGVHLNSARLRIATGRPLPPDRWVAASCHDPIELARARAADCDFAVLGPVMSTRSHERAEPLGWHGFRTLADCAGLPVYALGGMDDADIGTAWSNHGQGVAGISAWWATG